MRVRVEHRNRLRPSPGIERFARLRSGSATNSTALPPTWKPEGSCRAAKIRFRVTRLTPSSPGSRDGGEHRRWCSPHTFSRRGHDRGKHESKTEKIMVDVPHARDIDRDDGPYRRDAARRIPHIVGALLGRWLTAERFRQAVRDVSIAEQMARLERESSDELRRDASCLQKSHAIRP